MTNALKYFWVAEPIPFSETGEWQIASEAGERVVFCGLTKDQAEAIALTHNWEIQRIGKTDGPS